MRSARRLKTSKSSYRHKVKKRRTRRFNKSSCSLWCTQCVSMFDIDNINEVLRVHKSQRADGRGAWKVVPKDSCEVYKERQKRQTENNRRDDDALLTTDSDRTPTPDKKTQRQNYKKYRKGAVNRTRRRKQTRRREPNSSISSYTTTTTSCMSSSEMDYDDY